MNILNDSEVAALSADLQNGASEGKYLVSDLILEENGRTYQFVDLVMEGGGTLGIALVGYIYALEQAGIRFLSVGGSSVGAIVSLLLACGGKRTEEKGAHLAGVVSGMDMSSFIDGAFFPSALSRLLGSGDAGSKKLRVVLYGLLSLRPLFRRLGLNPGDSFLCWLTGCLAEYGIHTMADARQVIEYVPENITHRVYGTSFPKPEAELKLVAADLTTSSKVVFPEMAPLYWEDTEGLNPALFARASMSIPAFFQPMEVTGISKIVNSSKNWENLCSFEGDIPDRIIFSDGGLLSNFPISLFHQPGVPDAPTFGARLGSASRVVSEISSIGGYAGSLFSALRHYSDYEFIYQNPDYRRLITYIPTEGHNWLNFFMDDDEKLALFEKGMKAAYEFLECFDWPTYKEIRREQYNMDRAISEYDTDPCVSR